MASYGSTAGVDALLPGVGLGVSSTPNTTDVTGWLEQGYSIINRKLSAAGYTIPVSSSAAVYDELTALNNLYASAQVLRARGLDAVTGSEESRSERWLREFRESIDALAESDLTAVGVTMVTTTGQRRRGVRTVQIRRIDGFSGVYEGDIEEYDNVSD